MKKDNKKKSTRSINLTISLVKQKKRIIGKLSVAGAEC